MNLGETLRFACGDCQVVFDLCLAPASERAEQPEEGVEEDIDPTCCPFCGSSEIEPTHDRAIVLPITGSGLPQEKP